MSVRPPEEATRGDVCIPEGNKGRSSKSVKQGCSGCYFPTKEVLGAGLAGGGSWRSSWITESFITILLAGTRTGEAEDCDCDRYGKVRAGICLKLALTNMESSSTVPIISFYDLIY